MSEPGESMSTRDATYTACVEAMARAAYEVAWGWATDSPLPPFTDGWYEGCGNPEQYLAEAAAALDALLALRSDTECETCSGSGEQRSVYGPSFRQTCIACHGSGRVPTDTPLVVLRDDLEQVGWQLPKGEFRSDDVVANYLTARGHKVVPVYIERVRPHGESDTTERGS